MPTPELQTTADSKVAEITPELLPGLIAEAALIRRLGHKNTRTLRRWFEAGKGPARVRVGKSYFYRESSVQGVAC